MKGYKHALGWLLTLVICIGVFSVSALAAPFHGLPYQVHRVTTPDGAELVLYEIMADGGGDVIEYKIGFDQTAEAVDDRVLELVEGGHKVFIGQIRHAGRGENQSTGGPRGRVVEVLKYDGPTITREVIRRAGNRKVHGIGYSLGAIQYIAMATDPELAREFYPRISTLTLIGGPDNFRELPAHVKAAAKLLLPVFDKIRKASGRDTIEWTMFFDLTLKLKKSGNPALVASAHALERSAMLLGNAVLQLILSDTKHLSPKARRRLWLKDVSPLPLELLISLGETALTADGEIRDDDGRRMVDASKVTVPTQVIRGETDILAPMKQQQRMWERLGARVKRLLTIRAKHVPLTHGDSELFKLLSKHILDFITNPEKAVRSAPVDTVIKMPSFCERLLTALRS